MTWRWFVALVCVPQLCFAANPFVVKNQAQTGPGARFVTTVGNTAFFVGDDGVSGRELWKSDGTEAGTARVRDTTPGSGGSVDSLTKVGNLVFFRDGTNLWRSDGSEAGTILLRSGFFQIDELAAVGNTLFFVADDDASGLELWKSDGTAGGTMLVEDIVPGNLGSGPLGLVNAGGTLYFYLFEGFTIAIWRSDGTPAGTALVRGGYPRFPGFPSSLPTGFTDVGGRVIFFFINEDGNGTDVWATDGTPAGSQVIKSLALREERTYPVLFAGHAYFAAQEYEFAQMMTLYRTDGTAGGTVSVKDFQTNAVVDSEFAVAGNNLFFVLRTEAAGSELWKTDGTSDGTVLVRDIVPGPTSSFPQLLTAVGTTLFFIATDTSGGELWRSDGTELGTMRVKDIRPGAASSIPAELVASNSLLFFTADDGLTGRELWRSDGTELGTRLTRDVFVPGSTSPTISMVTATATPSPLRTSTATVGFPSATPTQPTTGATATPTAQTPTQQVTGTATPSQTIPCVGDCDGNGSVTVDEIVRGIGIALGTTSVDSCTAFDANGDRVVTVDEIVRAVTNALSGC